MPSDTPEVVVPPQVVAKFTFAEKHELFWYGRKSHRLVFFPQYDTSIPEDQRFSKATPTGRFEMQVGNPSAVAFFKPGNAYYVTFTEVVAPESTSSSD